MLESDLVLEVVIYVLINKALALKRSYFIGGGISRYGIWENRGKKIWDMGEMG